MRKAQRMAVQSVHDLWMHPEYVGFCTVGSDRWATDKFNLVNLSALGFDPVFADCDDASYEFHRSVLPQRTFSMDLSGIVRKTLPRFESLSYVEVRALDWAFRYGSWYRRLLATKAGEPLAVDSTVWDGMQALAEVKGYSGLAVEASTNLQFLRYGIRNGGGDLLVYGYLKTRPVPVELQAVAEEMVRKTGA